jgi:YidC/Oxa1 family membrane protein insertase
MFFYWGPFFPFLTGESGWLGPFLNLLPLVTIVLFLIQQKMFMPPPTDEQSAMQQKIMKYMMIFMGFMFFKVPAGLCVYFITSSIWSIVERLVLPKPKPAEPMAQAVLNVDPRPSGGDRKAKRR